MDKKIRDCKDNLVSKFFLFELKLANIEPKKLKFKSQARTQIQVQAQVQTNRRPLKGSHLPIYCS